MATHFPALRSTALAPASASTRPAAGGSVSGDSVSRRLGRLGGGPQVSGSGVRPQPTSNLLSGILEIEPRHHERQYLWTTLADAIVSVGRL